MFSAQFFLKCSLYSHGTNHRNLIFKFTCFYFIIDCSLLTLKIQLIQSRYQLDNIFRDYILFHSEKGKDFVIRYQSFTSSGYCRIFFKIVVRSCSLAGISQYRSNSGFSARQLGPGA